MDADVAIIGAGVAGLVAAIELVRAGTRVVVLDPGPPGGSARAQTGLLLIGLDEPPWRIQASLGAERAGELFRATKDGVDWLDTELGVQRGLLWASEKESERIASAITAAGLRAEVWSAEQAAAQIGTSNLGGGAFLPEGGWIDPKSADRLAVRVKLDLRAERALAVTTEIGAVRIDTDRGSLRAETVILAAGAGLRAFPFFAERLFTWREQRRSAIKATPPKVAGIGRQGWLQFAPAEGALLVSGARWGTPHFEEGESEPKVEPRVLRALDAAIAQNWPDARPERGSTYIATHSCDNLPLIGPLPGDPRVVTACGFRGSSWALGAAAGLAVADGLLGRASRLSLCAPARMS